MPGKGCKKHTPIVSEAQRRLFGAVAGGAKTKAKGLTKKKAKQHLREVKGKTLVERTKKRLRLVRNSGKKK